MHQENCSSCGGSGLQNTLEVRLNDKAEIVGYDTVIRACEGCGGIGKVWRD